MAGYWSAMAFSAAEVAAAEVAAAEVVAAEVAAALAVMAGAEPPPPQQQQQPEEHQAETGQGAAGTPERGPAMAGDEERTAEASRIPGISRQDKVERLRKRLPPPQVALKLMLSALTEMHKKADAWDARKWLADALVTHTHVQGEDGLETIELWAEATFFDGRMRALRSEIIDKCNCAAPQPQAEDAADDDEASPAVAPSSPACGHWGLINAGFALMPCAWTEVGAHIVTRAVSNPPRPQTGPSVHGLMRDACAHVRRIGRGASR